jgi:outer membrane protein
MKKFQWVCLTVVLAFLSGLAVSPALAQDKIGFYDMRQVVQSSDAGKRVEAEVKKINEKYEPRLKEIQADLMKLKDEIEKQRSVLKPEAINEKELAGKKKYRDFESLRKDYNDEVQAKAQELEKVAVPAIMNIVNTIGEKEKYKMILEISALLGGYFSKENDLTKRITDEFNKTYKATK